MHRYFKKVCTTTAFLITLHVVFNTPVVGATNVSPVVQIMSYKTTFERNTELLWWGSASIINDDGILITNNHVVDDGKGNPLEIFSICFSKQDGEKISCPYTATLIDRDKDKDIAILKIDPKDINGQIVNYKTLNSIEINYDYIPNAGDNVEAVGYPGVGSNTVTKTRGIVSGTAKYNDLTYIKTDTLIASGNSGGALIQDGKLVGIPTYTKGGFFDPSLGYALYISEAKDFIEANKIKTPIPTSLFNFPAYKKELDTINDAKKVNDNFISISFGSEYELINYIKDKKASFAPSSDTQNLPQKIDFYLQDTPSLKSNSDFLYYIESIGLYNKSYQKLKKLSYGGVDFYYPVSIYDASDGSSDTYKSMFGLYNGNLIIINSDFGYAGEDALQAVQKKFDEFMSKVIFRTTIKDIQHTFNIQNPKINFLYKPEYVYDDVNGIFTIYLNNNLREYIEMMLLPIDIYSGKGQDIGTLYEQETQDISNDYKTLIEFNGHPGFLYCEEKNSYYGYIDTDEKGNPLVQGYCKAKIFGLEAQNDSYILDITIVTDTKNIKSGLETLVKNLSKLVSIPKDGDGVTNLINVFANQVQLQFKDISGQKQGYKDKLKTLIKYGIVKNETLLGGDKPMMWGEFLDVYFRAIYGVQFSTKCKETDYACKFDSYTIAIDDRGVKLSKVFDDMGIKLNYYVNRDKLGYLQDYFDLIFSGVDPKKIDGEYLYNFYQLKDEQVFSDVKQKIDEFHYIFFGNKKILFNDLYPNSIATYIPKKILYFVNGKGLVEQKLFTEGKVNFSAGIDFVLPNKTFYTVLLKGQAVDYIISEMDLGLFDSDLAKRKNTRIDE